MKLDDLCTIPDRYYGYTRPSEEKSWRELLEEVEYGNMRKHIDVQLLAAHLIGNPHLLEQWFRYSEDKRTTGGWYLQARGDQAVVGRLDPPESEVIRPLATAVATYILRELDQMW
jgi:hypothetical protein